MLAPTNLAVGPLDDFWQQFIQSYLDIELAVELSNDFIDLKQARAGSPLHPGLAILPRGICQDQSLHFTAY